MRDGKPSRIPGSFVKSGIGALPVGDLREEALHCPADVGDAAVGSHQDGFTLDALQARSGFQQTDDMWPVDIAAPRGFVLIVLSDIVMEVAGGDLRVEFFQNVVIPLKRRPILPAADGGAVVGETAVAFHEVCVAGVVADAEAGGMEVMNRVEQFFRCVVGEPNVFDGDGDAEFLRDRQQNLQ